MTTINIPGFTADASLRTNKYSSFYSEELREFDVRSLVVPAMSCSSRDGSTDCFCGTKGCRRTKTSCDCTSNLTVDAPF